MPIKVGQKFNPGRSDHVAKVLDSIDADRYGDGWQISHYDQQAGILYLERRDAVTSVASASQGTCTVNLGRDFGPRDGQKAAARLEGSPEYAGMTMVSYDPYAGHAQLAKLTDAQKRCRGAVANVLGVEPWDVQVSSRRGGGYTVTLPSRYTPSKHDKGLTEVATGVVGKPGWYLDIDVARLTMQIVPSEPPTFPAKIGFPEDVAKQFAAEGKILFGKTLAATGDQDGEWIALDVSRAPHTSVNGTTGAGKSGAINSIIHSALLAGFELAVIDVPHKARDFAWVKPYVRQHGWGCNSLEDSVVAMKLLYEEGMRRASLLEQYDVEKMSRLPKDVLAENPPVLIVVDELSGLLQLAPKLEGLPKDHPDRVEAMQENALHSMLLGVILKIAAELRFTQMYLLLGTQVANDTTGVPPKLRTLLSGKLLLGVNQNDANRRQTFNDATAVPQIPEHLKVGKAGIGSGTCELEGQRPAVFKGVYEDPEDHLAAIQRFLLPKPGVQHEPTDAHRRRFCSFLYEDEDGEPIAQLSDAKRFSGGPLANDPDAAGMFDHDGKRLTGAAAAAAASRAHADPAPF